ncbi:S9 family peptidase [Candidatus Bathyarchaeota archaeon]|nr:S9 family peptidase [Candidatus Bathyarchaeota archaeon]MBL7078883.1 S9 family peptidase [Candidatus Bathyarchaeota archaeon]
MQKLEEIEVMPLFPMAPVGDPQISPDGSRVLFTYSEVNMEEDRYDTQIWLLDLEAKKPVQFTSGEKSSSNPRWSPKEDRVLFTSSRPSPGDPEDEKKKAQLFVIPADGGEARQVTRVDEAVRNPAWSPDGRSILFLANVFKGEKAEGSDVKIIRRMKYKHDGKGFSVGRYPHLFVAPAKGGKAKQVTDGLFDVEAAVWSPDSERIAFVAIMGEDADKSFHRNIYAVPAKGGEPELLLEGKGPIGTLEWSPDGRYIAFSGRELKDPGLVWHKNIEVYVLDLKEGGARCLTGDFDRTAGGSPNLKWSPDSGHIYALFPHHGTTHLHRIGLDGGVAPVTEGEIDIGSFSLDDSGTKIAFNASDAVTPAELFILDAEQRKLTEMNKGLLRKLRISPPEEFWFIASDGVEVQGWIVKPRGFREGEKYPACIQIHGGPRGAYGFKLDSACHEFQVLADHGYVVVYTNPRASIGYGEQFAGLISGAWGERDYMDIMEATDHVIENYGFVDPERFGVLGGSYGGFMTNWIVGHTDRYKAAITMRSISNWYSFHGTSDIGWMTLPTHELVNGKDPWDDPKLCMEKSPITYVKNMVTPMLIIHSEEDHRCPMEQGEQLYIALKKLGRTTEFVRFPDEPHGLSRDGKPKHRRERLQHIVRWFDRYLK